MPTMTQQEIMLLQAFEALSLEDQVAIVRFVQYERSQSGPLRPSLRLVVCGDIAPDNAKARTGGHQLHYLFIGKYWEKPIGLSKQ